ncbi:MAG TPA: hypothetical protein PLO98_07185, partial [Bacteroidia bacterium]|nr:hypothetical protein [Bacteroidia bacterium]
YFLAGPGTTNSTAGGIKKVTIKNDGSVTLNGRIYPTVANPNNNTGAEVFAQELDLSPDGKWLAWGSYAMVNHQSGTQFRYHILELDASGDYLNNSYKRFNIPNYTGNNTVSDFRGIEFYQSGNTTKLFVGAGIDGIFYINLPWSNWSSYPTPPPASDFTQISGSSGTNLSTYGKSQIELAYNECMLPAIPAVTCIIWVLLIHKILFLKYWEITFLLLYPMFLAVHGVLPFTPYPIR